MMFSARRPSGSKRAERQWVYGARVPTYYEIRDEMGRRRAAFQTCEEALRAVEEMNQGTEGSFIAGAPQYTLFTTEGPEPPPDRPG